ncbi:MAG: diguanylate cyclase, partial [Spirochaetes bacterium]|nr:diguanylate cyclase [Spirochaetota bacterium]
DVLFNNLPIIMLTVRSTDKDIITGWERGADDYIIKPFKPKLLLARINAILSRSLAKIDANPLTRLPGNTVIIRVLNEKLKESKNFAVLQIDLNNFKAFNDYYGYMEGDKVIQSTARIILDALKEKGNPDDFLGHIGGDDFLAVTTYDKSENICKYIIKKFDKTIPQHYKKEDFKKGYIEVENRKGVNEQFPLMGIVIGVVTNVKEFTHIGEIGVAGVELKRFAKKEGKSCYIIDRRRGRT